MNYWMIFLLIITERGLQSFQTLASKREATDFGFGGVEKTPKCIAQYYDQAFGVINGKQENKLLIYHFLKGDLRLRAKIFRTCVSLFISSYTLVTFFVMWHRHIVAKDANCNTLCRCHLQKIAPFWNQRHVFWRTKADDTRYHNHVYSKVNYDT